MSCTVVRGCRIPRSEDAQRCISILYYLERLSVRAVRLSDAFENEDGEDSDEESQA